MTDTTDQSAPLATLKQTADFLRQPGETLKSFTTEWGKMSDADKLDIRKGIGDGTFTY